MAVMSWYVFLDRKGHSLPRPTRLEPQARRAAGAGSALTQAGAGSRASLELGPGGGDSGQSCETQGPCRCPVRRHFAFKYEGV